MSGQHARPYDFAFEAGRIVASWFIRVRELGSSETPTDTTGA